MLPAALEDNADGPFTETAARRFHAENGPFSPSRSDKRPDFSKLAALARRVKIQNQKTGSKVITDRETGRIRDISSMDKPLNNHVIYSICYFIGTTSWSRGDSAPLTSALRKLITTSVGAFERHEMSLKQHFPVSVLVHRFSLLSANRRDIDATFRA